MYKSEVSCLQHRRTKEPLRLTEQCWGPVFELYVREVRKDASARNNDLIVTVERYARLCTRDFIAVTYLPAQQYEYMINRNIEPRYRQVYSYLWKEQDLFPVTDVFRRFKECSMLGKVCCKNLLLAPIGKPYVLNFRLRIKRCFLKNDITNEYDTLLPEEWMNEAFKETQYRWSETEILYAKMNYAFKSYYTNSVLFIMYDQSDRLNSLRVLNCDHCVGIMENQEEKNNVYTLLQ